MLDSVESQHPVKMGPEVLTALLAIFIAIAIIIYRNLMKKYEMKDGGLPCAKASFPFGSWTGAWGKVIGQEDVKNVEELGNLYWAFDGSKENFFVADPKVVKTFLLDKGDSFTSHRAERVNQPILKKSLQNIEKACPSVTLAPPNLKRLVPRVKRSVEALVHEIQKPEENIYVQPCLMQYIGDAIALVIFGIDMHSEDFKEQKATFMENINIVFKVQNPTSISSVIPYAMQSWKTLDNIILPREATDFFVELCESIINKKSELKKSGGSPEGKASDLIDLLLEMNEPKEGNKNFMDTPAEEYIEEIRPLLSEEDMTVQCLSLILYSVRSVEGVLSQAMHILANSPEEQTKVYNEIVKISQTPDGEILDSKYLDFFMREILRLYPAEYRLVRQCTKEVEVNDFTLNPGTCVTIPFYPLHHDKQFFDNASEFRPERFELVKVSVGSSNELHYMHQGAAACNPEFPGVMFAEIMIKLALAQLLTNFKLLPPSDTFKNELSLAKGATEVPVTLPVFVKLEKRA